MSKSRNWKAITIPSFTGGKIELTVTGEVNVGKLKIIPVLTRKSPQGINPKELILEVNVAEEAPDHFQEVRPYTQIITNQHQYTTVQILGPKGEALQSIIVQHAFSAV
jgi:hypothetical protein